MSNDTKGTIIGISLAVLTGVADYFAHAPMEGGVMKQPTYWLGLGIAALMAIKGYYMNKPDANVAAPK